jgi:ketosteroid isomerase-like protein
MRNTSIAVARIEHTPDTTTGVPLLALQDYSNQRRFEMLNTQTTTDAGIVERGWETVARGDWDALVEDYTDNMVFAMPGQKDELHGKGAFRDALDGLGTALPPGFNITSIRQIGDSGEVVSLIEWTSNSVPEGSQLAVLFKIDDSKIFEERWFVDTEQWKAAF